MKAIEITSKKYYDYVSPRNRMSIAFVYFSNGDHRVYKTDNNKINLKKYIRGLGRKHIAYVIEYLWNYNQNKIEKISYFDTNQERDGRPIFITKVISGKFKWRFKVVSGKNIIQYMRKIPRKYISWE